MTLPDGRGKPWCSVRVGNKGQLNLWGAHLVYHGSLGRVVEEMFPREKKILRWFNTLGLLEEEIV